MGNMPPIGDRETNQHLPYFSLGWNFFHKILFLLDLHDIRQGKHPGEAPSSFMICSQRMVVSLPNFMQKLTTKLLYGMCIVQCILIDALPYFMYGEFAHLCRHVIYSLLNPPPFVLDITCHVPVENN